MLQQRVSRLIFAEIPQYAFRQAGGGGLGLTGHFEGNKIAGEHELVDALVHFGLILLHPLQLGGGEVAGGIEVAPQALVLPQLRKCLVTDFHGPAVAPDDGGAKGAMLPVHHHQAVHLIRDTDGLDLFGRHPGFGEQPLGGFFHVPPPHVRVLFGPSLAHGFDFHF